MSPEGLRFTPEDKRRKKRHLRVVPLVEVSEEAKEKKPQQPAPFFEAILKSKPETDDKVAKDLEQAEKDKPQSEESKPEKPPVEQTAEATPEPEETATDSEQESQEEYETLYQELNPVDLSRGEVVVHLGGNTPRAERVVLLHSENSDEEVPKPEAPDSVALPFIPTQTQEIVPPAAGGGSGGGGGGETPPPSFEALPSPEDEPVVPHAPKMPAAEVAQPLPESTYVYRSEDESGESSVPVAQRKVATKQELEDVKYYAAKSGQSRGVTTGLFVGGAYEHFKHKRRQKKMEKHLEKQAKELKKLRTEQYYEKQKHEGEKREFQRQYQALERRFETAPQPEKRTARHMERAVMDEPEQLKVPENHRLENSAWHTIEVDAKTGKAVETPTFQYGHEYYRERAKEAAPLAQRNSAAGEIALVAAANAGQGGNSAASPTPTSPPTIPLATAQGSPSAVSKKLAGDSAAKAPKSASPAGPIWPWAVALVVIVVLLAILIH